MLLATMPASVQAADTTAHGTTHSGPSFEEAIT